MSFKLQKKHQAKQTHKFYKKNTKQKVILKFRYNSGILSIQSDNIKEQKKGSGFLKFAILDKKLDQTKF